MLSTGTYEIAKPVNLLLVDNAQSKRALVDLTLIYLLFHRAKADEAIDKDVFCLAKTVDSEQRLNIVRRIPARVEDDDAVGADQIGTNATGFCRDEE